MSTESPEKKTIREVESIVHASGEWDGTGPVEFSDDGETWTQAWAPTIVTGAGGEVIREAISHPEFARVEVYRKGVRIPTTVTIRWDEQYPAASEEWSGKWDRSPMRHFGRTVRMVGFRQTFRDLLGDIRIEEEYDDRDHPAEAAETAPAAERDWAAEYRAATTTEQLDELDAAARAARAFKPTAEGTALHRLSKDQRAKLVDAAWHPEPAEPEPAAEEQPSRPEPRDYLPPQNRADRRKAARKKGRRR
ncbi:hypothetical protein [Microbacterium paraoxydans]|uniref:hypothetical protein n=1 Tax=Microbacterium paraoxydans TaxID=199592 RepID=UPI003D743E3E